MSNYKRHAGDDLLSSDHRLKYNWQWHRIASMIPEEELKKWTHFQCSFCDVHEWRLGATRWGKGKNASYEADVKYKGKYITSKEGFKTRIDAQIAAENLLDEWIREQYKKIVKKIVK